MALPPGTVTYPRGKPELEVLTVATHIFGGLLFVPFVF